MLGLRDQGSTLVESCKKCKRIFRIAPKWGGFLKLKVKAFALFVGLGSGL